MNTKSRRLNPLITRAEEREAAVARELAAKTRQLASQEQRLSDLLRYADEYAISAPGSHTHPALLANREQFRGKLKEAIGLQQRAIEQARSSADFERSRLMLAARDTRVLARLADSYRNEERRSLERREQNAMDEHAVRVYLRLGRGEG